MFLYAILAYENTDHGDPWRRRANPLGGHTNTLSWDAGEVSAVLRSDESARLVLKFIEELQTFLRAWGDEAVGNGRLAP